MSATNPKKKCRQYSQHYLKFGFVPSPMNETMPMCLLCQKTFSNDAMKPAKMKDHLERVHPDMKDKDLLEICQVLKQKIRDQPTLKRFFKIPTDIDDEGLKVSYNISLNIAKKGQPHTIGEDIIIPAVKEVVETVMKKDSQPVLKCIPLCANAVQRHIDEMASDVEKMLVSELQKSKFTIQLDESMFGSSNILMAYVRYYSQSQKHIIDEFLFSKHIHPDPKGETIFQCLEEYLKEYDIPFNNITAVATDGAQAVVSRYRGFATFLKEKIPNVCIIHCVLHKHHLVAKRLSDKLHDALTVCIRSINKIKTHSLNSQLFALLCEGNDEMLNQLLLHSELRWLSIGNCLQRVIELYDSIVEFLADVDSPLCADLIKSKNHLFYIADLYSEFNDVQIRLLGKDVTIMQVRTILSGFQVKLGLFRSSLARKDFSYFSNLKRLEREKSILDDDLEIYINHLEMLREDFQVRFKALEKMHVPDWIITPFDVEIENAVSDCHLQSELIEMSVDLEAKLLFRNKSLSDYWSNVNIVTKYPKLFGEVVPLLLAFPSLYMIEAGFSHTNSILTRHRNCLNLEDHGDLRLKITNFQPNVSALISDHKVHPSL